MRKSDQTAEPPAPQESPAAAPAPVFAIHEAHRDLRMLCARCAGSVYMEPFGRMGCARWAEAQGAGQDATAFAERACPVLAAWDAIADGGTPDLSGIKNERDAFLARRGTTALAEEVH